MGESVGGGGLTIHDFAERLAFSHAQEDRWWWKVVYEKAFPTMVGMRSVRNDGWAQRGGIDRLIDLDDGTTIKVDEKVRSEDWPDIALEVYSDEARKSPGWVIKGLTCDFIGYAFVPSETCYMLPYQTLRSAFESNRHRWATWASNNEAGYKLVRARNRGYVTLSVAIPIPDLMEAIKDALVIEWGVPF